MSEFEMMKPELLNLFLRLDAAMPTDPVLQAAAAAWKERRGKALLPDISLLQALPTSIRAHVFLARMLADGERDWMFSDAGAFAHASLGAPSGRIREAAEPPLAQRLESLFELVTQKGEPCSGMFELQGKPGRTKLCEVYAAPLTPQQTGEAALFVAFNWRAEAMR